MKDLFIFIYSTVFSFFFPFPNLHFSLLTNSFIQNIFWWYQCNLAKVSYAQWMLHHILKPPNLPNMNIRHTGSTTQTFSDVTHFYCFQLGLQKIIFFTWTGTFHHDLLIGSCENAFMLRVLCKERLKSTSNLLYKQATIISLTKVYKILPK